MEKIIVVHYIGIKDMDKDQVDVYINNMHQMVNKHPDDSIINYLIPSPNFSDAWIECINPKLVTVEEYEKVSKILDRFYDIHKSNIK